MLAVQEKTLSILDSDKFSNQRFWENMSRINSVIPNGVFEDFVSRNVPVVETYGDSDHYNLDSLLKLVQKHQPAWYVFLKEAIEGSAYGHDGQSEVKRIDRSINTKSEAAKQRVISTPATSTAPSSDAPTGCLTMLYKVVQGLFQDQPAPATRPSTDDVAVPASRNGDRQGLRHRTTG